MLIVLVLLRPAAEAEWEALAAFYGLEADAGAARAAGVLPFPRHALVLLLFVKLIIIKSVCVVSFLRYTNIYLLS